MISPTHPLVIGTLAILFTAANILTCYLYTYPIVHGCAFPAQPVAGTEQNGFSHFQTPPFRLLVLGDPQLEGDSSLLYPEDGFFRSLYTAWSAIRAGNLSITDIPRILQSYRKRLDLIGNDFYLAHIYRSLQWSLSPTHATVLGDLIGSQWVSDEEFERRGTRYWQRVFQNGRRVEDELMNGIHIQPLGQDDSWNTRVINVAGNHDIGYAGDMTLDKMQRFEKVYGKANWETRFNLPSHSQEKGEGPPELRLVVLNSLNLDAPVFDASLQEDTYHFLNDIITTSRPVEDPTTLTILLTHLPLHKEDGVCVDGPYFTYHSEEHGGGIKEQNHLSYDASKMLFEGIFGMSGDEDSPGKGFGRKGLILTGHDHEGCDVHHGLAAPVIENGTSTRTWLAERSLDTSVHSEWGPNEEDYWRPDKWDAFPGIREITIRSMMGDFGGNAGLLSAWFNHEKPGWEFEFSTCSLGTQHLWWAVHVLDLVTIALLNIVGWSMFFQTGQVKPPGGSKEKTL